MPCVADDEPNATAQKKFTKLVHEHDAVCDADCPAHIYAANSKLHMVEKWEEIINVFDFGHGRC